MSEYYGKISDLPLDEKNNFIPNSEEGRVRPERKVLR